MYLAVGLGNPGKEYIGTRHNIGFEAADELLKRFSSAKIIEKHQSVIGTAVIGEHNLIIAKPQIFMNNSGVAVKEISRWYKVPNNHIIIMYDDADLEIGVLRIRTSGSSGGHKGIESIIKELGTNEFVRIKIGIGRTNFVADLAEYVLKKIPKGDREILNETVISAADAVENIVSNFNRGVA